MAVSGHLILLVSLLPLVWSQQRYPSENGMQRNKFYDHGMREPIMRTTIMRTMRTFKTTKPPIHCSQQSFVGAGECCKESPYDLYNREAHLKCYEIDNNVPRSLEGGREYLLNLWQNYNANNALELYGGNTERKNLMACHLECIYKNNGLITFSETMVKLNHDAIADYFNTKSEPLSRAIVMDAVSNCSKVVPYVIANTRGMRTDAYCSPHAFLYTQCLVKEIILNCNMPVTIDKGSGNFDDLCKRHRNLLQRCDVMPSSLDVSEVDFKFATPENKNSKVDITPSLKPIDSSEILTKPTIKMPEMITDTVRTQTITVPSVINLATSPALLG